MTNSNQIPLDTVTDDKVLTCLKEAESKPLPEVLLSLGGKEFQSVNSGIFAHCRETQQTVLMEILNRCKDTEFGKKYGFGNMRSPEDYQRKMPFTEWEDHEPYSKRLEMGEADLLFPGRAVSFYITSGTTSGSKLIPESIYGENARKIIYRARKNMTIKLAGDLYKADACIISLANVSVAYKTPAGIPCGSASGMATDLRPKDSEIVQSYPPKLRNVYSGDELNYMMLRCMLTRDDMVAVVGNNPARFTAISDYALSNAEKLIEDIRNGSCALPIIEDVQKDMEPYLTPMPERAEFLSGLLKKGQFLPRFYWPKIMLGDFWLGGSVGMYVGEAKRILPEGAVLKDIGYGSSEIKINIPFNVGSPVGTLATYCGFFEFIPEDGGEALMAHQLEDGKRYELVVTTYSGLYRYKLHDLIEVDGFTGNTPNIFFVTKLGDIGSIAQEKLHGFLLARYAYDVAEELGQKLSAVQGYTDMENKRYVIYMELSDPESVDTTVFANGLEKKLNENIEMYRLVREVALKPLSVKLMKTGWKEHLFEKYRKGALTISQVKPPVIVTEPPESEWLLTN